MPRFFQKLEAVFKKRYRPDYLHTKRIIICSFIYQHQIDFDIQPKTSISAKLKKFLISRKLDKKAPKLPPY